MESNLDKIVAKIEEKPHLVMNEIGKNLVKEIKPKVNTKRRGRDKFLRATLQYWARRKERDLIIGFKDPMKIGFLRNNETVRKMYPDMLWAYDEVDDPIKPTMVNNIPNIQKLIGKALAEIEKE